MTDKTTVSLARGNSMNQATWDDFVNRLRHHCRGRGVHHHHTANAIFTVQAKRLVYGLDTNYSDKSVIIWSEKESQWFSIVDFWNDLGPEEQARLNALASYDYGDVLDAPEFLSLDEVNQWSTLEGMEGITITGYDERWEYVNAHFTMEAAEAFIERKKHDYSLGLRVYVESQTYCWEFNAIKDAILDGTIGYTGGSNED